LQAGTGAFARLTEPLRSLKHRPEYVTVVFLQKAQIYCWIFVGGNPHETKPRVFFKKM